MTIDEVIKEFTDWAKDKRNEQNFWLAQRNESDETSPLSYADCNSFARDSGTDAERYEQLAKWLRELKDKRVENEILMAECDRLIKEKGELLGKVSGGDVLRICQLEEQLKEAKRLLKAAIEDFNVIKSYLSEPYSHLCNEWRYTDEALKLIRGESNGV